MKAISYFINQAASILLLIGSILLPASSIEQTPLWGLTSSGGQGAGTIIKMDDNGANFSSIEFPVLKGSSPTGDLLKATNGKFYGLTSFGGDNDGGLIFEYDLSTNTYQVLHHFMASSNPKGSLIESGGKLYGLTSGGGSSGFGVIFEYNMTTSSYTQLYSFGGQIGDGKSPEGSLVELNGNLYGMTPLGGLFDFGSIFRYDLVSNIHTVIHSFDDTNDGSFPYGSLMVSGQSLHGLTSSGGPSFGGVLFEYNLIALTMNVLYAFDDDIPYGSLIEYNGNFYGMTLGGGSNFEGSLFKYSPLTNSYSELVSFDTDIFGSYPFGSLVQSSGKLYGMNNSGGFYNGGVLFEYELVSNTYNILHQFDPILTGGGTAPFGSPIVSDGKLFGLTSSGGTTGAGTLFEYNISGGPYNVKVIFGNSSVGSSPEGNLIVSGTNLYGMTKSGGNSNQGTIFKYDTNGSGTLSALHHFSGSDGGFPSGSLILYNGKLYGLTSQGGTNDGGVLLEYDLGTSTYNIKYNFGVGSAPKGSLIEWNGFFYGFTSNGGITGNGELFKFDPTNNNYEVLHNFDGATGSFPFGNIVQMNGMLYGMTTTANTHPGVLFSYDPVAPAFDVLHYFSGMPSDGAAPYGSLLIEAGELYGMTRDGGSSNKGTMFKYNPLGGGTYTVLHQFDNTNGGNPEGSLSSLGSSLYGMAKIGGSFLEGVAFKCDFDGTNYTILKNFDDTSGKSPFGGLTAGGCTVTNTNDSGVGSLRAAIACTIEGGTITFDPSVLGVTDTIIITSSSLDISKNININQTVSTIVKIKSAGPNPIFNISAGKSLTLTYTDLFVNHNPTAAGRAILNNGNLEISNVNIQERSQNIISSGSTIQNESGSSLNVTSNNQIIIQN